jgi:hypothetical protein
MFRTMVLRERQGRQNRARQPKVAAHDKATQCLQSGELRWNESHQTRVGELDGGDPQLTANLRAADAAVESAWVHKAGYPGPAAAVRGDPEVFPRDAIGV